MRAKDLFVSLAVIAVAAAPACRVATVYEPCVDDPGACPACAGHDECSFQGNDCTDAVYCAHVESGLSFIEIGCVEASEYSWPPDEECRCIDGVCRWDR
jgi:hypothetical protein